MVIVDSTVWVDYLHGSRTRHVAWLESAIERQRIGLSDLILCEVLQGIRSESVAASTAAELQRFEIFSMGGADLAVKAAANYRYLRARGVTIRRTIDCIIATFCLLHGHSLLHADRDFTPFERLLSLRVIHPASVSPAHPL